MSTRANILVVCGDGKFKFQSNSSAYPSNMMKAILKFAISTYSTNRVFEPNKDGFYPNPDSNDLATFIDECGLTLGSVGNASYYYEIDFVRQHVKVWDNQRYWHNAPKNWRERGWQGVYEHESNGSWGYMNWRKGKLIYLNTSLRSLINFVTKPETQVMELSDSELKFAESIG